ncbi:type IV toxin-antitoxin system AbiEi family antitoxin domain-containing protein [Oligoflexia bacterium]|nr:type IV toxin-antitoxin system AbiEi family antitoxin domain-containing protein [Oligoflexia bacterium]
MAEDPRKSIVSYLKKIGVARAKDFVNLGIAREYLSRLVEDGTLIRTSRGVYRLADDSISEFGHFAEIAKRVDGGVVCLLSALRFHEIGTQNPSEVWLAIHRRSRKPNIDYPALQVVWFSGKAFTEGIEYHKIDGARIAIYSIAKTVADCFKYRNKIGIDVCIEALRDSLEKRRVKPDKIWHYASVCRVNTIIRPYMEALL